MERVKDSTFDFTTFIIFLQPRARFRVSVSVSKIYLPNKDVYIWSMRRWTKTSMHDITNEGNDSNKTTQKRNMLLC